MMSGTMSRSPEQILSGIRLRLRGKSAFFSTLLLHARVVFSEQIETAATDGETIYIHPQYLSGLSSKEAESLLLHQTLHAALSHASRRGTRDKMTWNRAADVVVNGMLASLELPPPEGSQSDENLQHLSAEEVYAVLLNQPLEEEYIPDLLELQGDSKRTETHWNAAYEQAKAVALMAGEEALGYSRHVEWSSDSQLDWRSALWRFMVRTPADFGGFDRRFVGRGLYLEGLEEDSLEVMVVIDTSGSLDTDMLEQFLTEVRSIARAYPYVRVTLWSADTQLYGPYDLEDTVTLEGGGGTDFRPAFARLEEEIPAPQLLVYLTDGYGNFPEEAPSGTDILWVVTAGGLASEEFPFGEVLRLGAS